MQLLRPRLLPSALADVVAGVALARVLGAVPLENLDGGLVLRGLVFALLVYASGMVLGDVADVEEDRRLGRARPIVAGHIDRKTAALFGLVLIVVALLVAPGFYGYWQYVLVGLVLAYSFVTKRVVLAGALTLAACRGLNLALPMLLVSMPAQASLIERLAELGSYAWLAVVCYGLYAGLCVVHGSLEDLTPAPSGRSRCVAVLAALLPFSLLGSAARPELLALASLPTLVLGLRSRSAGPGWVGARSGILLRGLARFDFALACGVGAFVEAIVLAIPAYVLPWLLRPKSWS